MLTIAGNVVKYLRYWKTALKNRAFRCSFQREGDGESPSASLFAASLERPRESAAGASRYRSAEMCASTIRVVPRLTSPLSWGGVFMFESPRQRLPLGSRGAGPKGLRGFERCKFWRASEPRICRGRCPHRPGRAHRFYSNPRRIRNIFRADRVVGPYKSFSPPGAL